MPFSYRYGPEKMGIAGSQVKSAKEAQSALHSNDGQAGGKGPLREADPVHIGKEEGWERLIPIFDGNSF